jgi:hypothetical protein
MDGTWSDRRSKGCAGPISIPPRDLTAIRFVIARMGIAVIFRRHMSIAIQIHDSDPAALAELLARAMHENVVIDAEPEIAHLSELLTSEQREIERRRAEWHWLNSLSQLHIDKDNDWSEL